MIQCVRGHFFDENRYADCPYCSQASSKPRAVTPPVAPNMEIPKPSCGKTVAVEGVATEPAVSKTVAIENFEETLPPVNKTVAISEQPSAYTPGPSPDGLPSMAPAAVPAPAPVPPMAAPVAQEVPAVPVAAPVAPIETPVVPVEFQPAPVAAPVAPMDAPVAPVVQAPDAPVAPVVPAAPVERPIPSYTADLRAEIPFDGVSDTPERVLTEEISVDIPVTGLGVSDHPTPLASEENYYHSNPDRPYAVTGLGVKENPTPIPNDTGATFPIPGGEGQSVPAGQPASAEAAAFAAFGFPGGPMPGMMPGGPMPGAPMPGAPVPPPAPIASPVDATPAPIAEPAPIVEETPVEPIPEPAPMAEAVAPAAPIPEPAPIVEEAPADPAAEIPAAPVAEAPVAPVPGPMFVDTKPRDPNATVAMTESDMDYLPRVHARAFLVCVDGPMTGASFVFQENRAIVGRQKNYEIALFRDNSVSRSPHAIIAYDKDAVRYTVAQGDPEKKVSVNGTFINAEQEIKLYDIIGIGQTRMLFIPVCSEKFAW